MGKRWGLAGVVLACVLSGSGCGEHNGKGDSDVGGGSGGSGGKGGSYTLCDGSDDIRLAWSQGGGQVDTTYEFTNPYGMSFLFVDGNCHYYASAGWLQGVVEGDLDEERALALQKSAGLAKVEALDYHDADSCPDAGIIWLRTAAGYVDCTCGCDAKAPAVVEPALDVVGNLKDELIKAGTLLTGPLTLLAIVEDAGSTRGVTPWPLIWPLSDIAMTWEAYTRKIKPTTRVLEDDEAVQARALRANALRADPYASGVHASDLGKVYDLFMRDELPDPAQRAIARLLDR